MKEKRTVRIGLWGGVGAGKATYLTALYRYLNKSQEWSLTVHPRFSELVLDYSHALDAGKFPDIGFALPKNYTSVESLTYTLTPKTNPNVDQVTLSFLAAPGKFYETCFFENVPIIEHQHRYDNAVNYYLSFDGILLLLDWEKALSKDRVAYHKLLGDFFTFLQRYWQSSQKSSQSQKLPHYFAFCLNKADLEMKNDPWTQESNISEAQRSLFSLGQKTLGESAFSIIQGSLNLDLKNYYNPRKNRCLFYYISSVGRKIKKENNRQTYIKVVSIDENNSQSSSDFKDNTGSGFTTLEDASKNSDREDIFNFSEQESNYSDKQPTGKIEVPSSLEALNVFAPLQQILQSAEKYPPLLSAKKG